MHRNKTNSAGSKKRNSRADVRVEESQPSAGIESKEAEVDPESLFLHSDSSGLSVEENTNPEVFDNKWDRTKALENNEPRDGSSKNTWKRRLDSIARLIEGSSICAAIAIKGNSFLISTNKNFYSNSTDKDYLLIDEVMSFFKDVAGAKGAGGYSKAQFAAVFKQICAQAITGLQLPAYIRDDLLGSDFIDKMMNSTESGVEDFIELRDYISENTEYGHCSSGVGSAFVVCNALMRDFKKVIKFISDNRQEDGVEGEDNPTRKFIRAIKGYSKENFINNEKLAVALGITPADSAKKYMHAEMKILTVLEEKLKNHSIYVNYIGISKLCCLDCHVMIYAVNHVAGCHNHIEIRGAHNVEHAGNWEAPFRITGPVKNLIAPKISSDKRQTRKTSVDDEFTINVIAQFNDTRSKSGISLTSTGESVSGATGVPESPQLSQSSEGEEDDYYKGYCSYLLALNKVLEKKKSIVLTSQKGLWEGERKVSEEIEIIQTGLKIYCLPAFKRVCEAEIEDYQATPADVRQNTFKTFLGIIDKEELSHLATFLQNPLYSNEKVSAYFKGFDFNFTPKLNTEEIPPLVDIGAKEGQVDSELLFPQGSALSAEENSLLVNTEIKGREVNPAPFPSHSSAASAEESPPPLNIETKERETDPESLFLFNSVENANAEVFNKRWDRTKALEDNELRDGSSKAAWKRRLDSIARLIEGSSICAAISIEEGSFLIGINKNLNSDSTDKDCLLIDEVMSFFKGVAETKDVEEYNKVRLKEVFKQICTQAITGLRLPAYIRDDLLKSDFVDKVMESTQPGAEDFIELRDYISENTEYGHCASGVGSAFVVCVALMRDFKKVIKFISDNRQEDKAEGEDNPTRRFIRAIKGYSKENFISNEKLAFALNTTSVESAKKTMHAEMKILAILEKKLRTHSTYSNYVGISKLCCLDCHAMIYAVNHVVDCKNHIEIRGAHNVEHIENWESPFRSREDEDKFVIAVTAQAQNAREKAGISSKRTGGIVSGVVDVTEAAELSQSSGVEEEDYHNKYCAYLLALKKVLEKKQAICPGSQKGFLSEETKIAEEIKIIQVGLKIYHLPAFKTICGNDLGDCKGVQNEIRKATFDVFLGNIDEEDRECLRMFLSNPVYSNEKASTYFEGFDFNFKRRGAQKRKPPPVAP